MIITSSLRLLLALLLAGAALSQQAQAQPSSTPRDDFWRTDGAVNSIVSTNGVAYIGGDFNYVGPASGAAGLLDSLGGDPITGFPKLNGTVRTIIPDASGGWYVGGNFVAADNTHLQNLIHVRADNTLDSAFKPNPDQAVRALALVGNSLLVGGEFFQIADNQLSYFVTLNPSTGKTNIIASQLRVSGVVSAFAVVGDTVYVGGQFNNITTLNGNQRVNNPRTRLAAFKPATAELLAWNPACSGGFEGVKAIVVSGSTIYVGGDFTSCGGKPRNGIASLKDADGTANNWNPNAQISNGTPNVNALAVVGNVVYAGGDFTSIGARSRTRLAALQAGSFGQADANWQADANGEVNFITVDGTDILVGGKFTVIGGNIDFNPANNQTTQTGGTNRRGFARVAQANAAVSNWGPQVSLLKPAQFGQGNATSYALGVQGDMMLLGGDFISFGGVNRAHLAAIDLHTGVPTAWDPGADQTVRAMALASSGVYVGGAFTNIGGASHSRIALLNYATGQADPWDARFQTGQYISAIATGNKTVFVGGQFQKIGGQDRSSLAELDAKTGDATDWNPQPSGTVNALVVGISNNVYVGGQIFGISGSSLQYLALLTTNVIPAKQLIKAFDAKLDGQIRALALTSDALYVAGDFTKASGQDRVGVAALDQFTSQEVNPWDAQISGQGQRQVRAVLPVGQAVYVGGQFRAAGGENRGRIASIHPLFGAASSWDPGADGPVNAIAREGNTLIIGGEFTRLGLHGTNPNPNTDGQPVPYLAAFDTRPAISSFQKNAAGKYTFNITDGDGLGSSLLLQTSPTLTNPNWQTVKTLDILGLQDPVDDTPPAGTTTRFYRLQRQP